MVPAERNAIVDIEFVSDTAAPGSKESRAFHITALMHASLRRNTLVARNSCDQSAVKFSVLYYAPIQWCSGVMGNRKTWLLEGSLRST